MEDQGRYHEKANSVHSHKLLLLPNDFSQTIHIALPSLAKSKCNPYSKEHKKQLRIRKDTKKQLGVLEILVELIKKNQWAIDKGDSTPL